MIVLKASLRQVYGMKRLSLFCIGVFKMDELRTRCWLVLSGQNIVDFYASWKLVALFHFCFVIEVERFSRLETVFMRSIHSKSQSFLLENLQTKHFC